MKENRFIEKFQYKTDSELDYIIENREKYNEQAINASIQILKERNGESENLESVENEIKVDGYINYTMDGIALSEGLYYLTVKGSEVNFMRKVIISK